MKARRVPNAVGFSLARNRRSPKGPAELRPSGVHPEESEVEKKKRSHTELRSNNGEILEEIREQHLPKHQ